MSDTTAVYSRATARSGRATPRRSALIGCRRPIEDLQVFLRFVPQQFKAAAHRLRDRNAVGDQRRRLDDAPAP